MLKNILSISTFLLISSGLMYAQSGALNTDCSENIKYTQKEETSILKEGSSKNLEKVELLKNIPNPTIGMTNNELLVRAKKLFENGTIDANNYEIFKNRIENLKKEKD